MAVSAQSGALRAVPGMGQRPASVAAYTPTYPTIPTLPAVPALDRDAQTPGYVGRQLIGQQLGALGTQQNSAFTTAAGNTGQALKGYGGYQFQKDDPSTAQREDLLIDFDPSRGMGEREKAAYRQSRDAANASGMLESGFANQNIASAVQRVSLEAQQIVNQYAATINNIATDYANQGANLAVQYAGLYGQDAAWLVANPPKGPVMPPTEIRGGVEMDPNNAAKYDRSERFANPETMTPAEMAANRVPPKNNMTYTDFLRGRKSTTKLARQWDAQFNYGRRFG
jgi:hypothetical protein